MAKTVLTVDDSLSIRQTVKLTLASAGYTVVEASSGKDALKVCETGGIDTILTDLNMPEMDGIELIRLIRTRPAYKFTPILMLTTETQQEKKLAGKSAGATGWIVKPFTPDQLLRVLAKVCPQ